MKKIALLCGVPGRMVSTLLQRHEEVVLVGTSSASPPLVPEKHVVDCITRIQRDELVAFSDHCKELEIDLICLVGFMYILPPQFVQMWPLKILNLHPALLPAFPGRDPQQQALNYGVRITGTTVHFVDESVDGGPIVGQMACVVKPSDTLETLSDRLRETGQLLYPLCVEVILYERWRLEGRKVVVHGPS